MNGRFDSSRVVVVPAYSFPERAREEIIETELLFVIPAKAGIQRRRAQDYPMFFLRKRQTGFPLSSV